MLLTTSKIPITVLRGFQSLFAIAVLDLSITLIKGHQEGAVPASLGFAAAVGGLSLLAAVLGIVANFVDFLQEQIAGVIDGVVLLLNVAGGILMAIKLKGVSCKIDENRFEDFVDTVSNDVICGGIDNRLETPWSCYYVGAGRVKTIERRCRESTADSAFMFLTAVMVIAVGMLTYLRMKKGY